MSIIKPGDVATLLCIFLETNTPQNLMRLKCPILYSKWDFFGTEYFVNNLICFFSLQMLRKYSNDWICSITDISEFVRSQHELLQKEDGEDMLETPKEEVYPVDKETATQIDMNNDDE